jgi:hypothetical protein
VTSGVLVPSNYWRAAEVIITVEARGLPEATGLREAYQEHCKHEDDNEQVRLIQRAIEQTSRPDES